MNSVEEILKAHTKIQNIEKTYRMGTEVEITVRQNGSNIYMFAYNSVKDRNISIYSNYKKLYNGFKRVATRITQDKQDYYLKVNLKEDIIEPSVGVEDIRSIDKEKLIEENKDLRIENSSLKLEVEALKHQIQELEGRVVKPLKNERGAGRPSMFTEEEVLKIRALKGAMSIRKIADEFDCSPSLVHKLIKEQNGV